MVRTLLICLSLVALVAVVYAPIRHGGFIDYDDNIYIEQNQRVHAGLTADNIRWAATTLFFSNWHPLTWLSYMLDRELFDLDPGKMHVENVAFHAGSTMLLFLVLQGCTARPWRSAMVAAVFGAHPTHVESVAWLAERKDVLSVFFLLLALGAYVLYAKETTRWRWGWYAGMIACYALSLASKAMGVTFPAVLLLLDAWPLRRTPLDWVPLQGTASDARLASWRTLVIEKLPLLIMALAVAVVTVVAQQRGGSVARLETMPAPLRLANLLLAYAQYAGKFFLPVNLAVFYPLRRQFPPAAVLSAAALLGVTTVLLWRLRRRAPHLLVGWLWFAGTLVPVIGIVQVGQQGMADRYTYLPSIGLSIAVVWTLAGAAAASPARLRLAATVGAAVIALLAITAQSYVRLWNDPIALFNHALTVTEDNAVSHYQLGTLYGRRGDLEAAAGELSWSLRLQPRNAKACMNLANCIYTANPAQAIQWYRKAVEIGPIEPGMHGNLANAQLMTGDLDGAEASYRQELALDPAATAARNGLAAVQRTRATGSAAPPSKPR